MPRVYTPRERGHAGVCAFPSDSRNWTTRLKLSPTLFQKGRSGVVFWGRPEGERTPRIPDLSLHSPSKPRFVGANEDTRVAAPRLPCYDDVTVCNRRSCARRVLIWVAFEVRRIFAPALGNLSRLARWDGIFQSETRISSAFSLFRLNVFSLSTYCHDKIKSDFSNSIMEKNSKYTILIFYITIFLISNIVPRI